MQGNLKQIQLPEVLQFISMGKSSGRLTVRDKAGNETALVISQGRIINSTAFERQRRLGDLLIHRGFLKRSDLTKVLNLQRTAEPNKKLGQLLVEHDFIRESQIRDVLRVQLEEEIWNLFGLEEGEFRFDTISERDLGDTLVTIEIDPLLLEGTRRQDEWRKIVRLLPSDRLVPAIKPRPPGEKFPRFSPLQWRVLAQINGRFPIRAIINRSGLGRFEVYQVIADLVEDGILHIIKDEEQAKLKAAMLETNDEVVEVNGTPLAAQTPGGISSFLSRLTGGTRRDERREKIEFETPIGLLAHIANRIVDQMLATRTDAPANEGTVLEKLWREMLISFPKCDLITVEKTRLRVDLLEDFLEKFEMSDATLDTMEESIEALVTLIDGLFRLASTRLGEKAAVRIFKEIVDDVAPRVVVRSGGDNFRLTERLGAILKVGA
jgi:hypothetical protein